VSDHDIESYTFMLLTRP